MYLSSIVACEVDKEVLNVFLMNSSEPKVAVIFVIGTIVWQSSDTFIYRLEDLKKELDCLKWIWMLLWYKKYFYIHFRKFLSKLY